jgi:uncharacterized coiled-coil protein SlyX
MTNLSITATQSQREEREDNSQSQRDDDSRNLEEGRLQSMAFTLDIQGTTIVGLEATIVQQGTTIVQQGTKIVGLEATIVQQGTKIVGLEATIVQQGTKIVGLEATIVQQGTKIVGLEATIVQQGTTMSRFISRARVAAFRIAIRDLNSLLGMLQFFNSRNPEISRQLVTMNHIRVRGAHFLLVDPKVKKPINLETYNPKDTFNFDDVPALLYKILLLKRFICGPDFPQDIEQGLGEGLMMGLRRYLNSPLVNQLLTPQISDEVKDRVIESVNIFFEDVHEFHI